MNLTKSIKLGWIGEYIYARQLSGEKAGFTLPFSPPVTSTLSLQFRPEKRVLGFTENYVTLDHIVTAAQNQIVPPEEKTPGYQVVNLLAGTTLKSKEWKIRFTISIHNLFNAKYLDHTSFYRLIEVPQPGRNITIGIKVPFHSNWSSLTKTNNSQT